MSARVSRFYLIALVATVFASHAPEAYAQNSYQRFDDGSTLPMPDQSASERAAQERARRGYAASLRPGIGVGIGNVGGGYRLGGSGEIWLTNRFGLGLQGARIGQTNLDFFGRKEESWGWFAGPMVGWRSRAYGSYPILLAGAGYAEVSRKVSEFNGFGFCWDSCPPEPPPPKGSGSYHGLSANFAVGWLAHPSDAAFEIGIIGRIDVMIDPRGELPTDTLFTANVELGPAI